MATKSNRSGAGGGPASRQVKNNQAGRKVEPNPRAVSPGAVSQIGSSMGNHATDRDSAMKPKGGSVPLYSGSGYKAPYGVRLNAKPEVMGSGTQGCHGAAAGTPKPRGATSCRASAEIVPQSAHVSKQPTKRNLSYA